MDKKDLDAIGQLLDKKFDERFEAFEAKMDKKIDDKFDAFEIKMNKKIDDKFDAFEIKMDKKLDIRFNDFKCVFSAEIAEVFHDVTFTIDARFEEMKKDMNQKFAIQDKKIDLLLQYSKDNLIKHEEYDQNFSKIHSQLFDHDVRLNSLETLSSSAI